MLFKKLVFISIMIFSTVQGFAQYFKHVYDFDLTNDWGRSILKLDNGSFFIIGNGGTNSVRPAIMGMTILSDGSRQQTKFILRSATVEYYQAALGNVKKARSGYIGILNQGITKPSGNRQSAGLMKLDEQFDTSFVRGYTDTSLYFEQTLDCDTAQYGNFVFAGQTNVNGGGWSGNQGFLKMVDSVGVLKWSKEFRHTVNKGTVVSTVQSLPGGNILVGACNSTPKSKFLNNWTKNYDLNSPWFLIFDSVGNVIYQHYIPTVLAGGGAVYKDKQGGYYHWGALDSFITNNPLNFQNLPDYVAHLNDSFQIDWLHSFADTNAHKNVWTVKQLNNNDYVVAGIENHFGWAEPRGWAARVDKHGTLLWEQNYCIDSTGICYLIDVVEELNGDLVFSGSHRDNSLPQSVYQDVLVIKTDSNGCPSLNCQFPTGVENLPELEAGFKVYPNPVIDVLKVENLLLQKNTEVIITDIMGKTIAQQNLSAQLTFVDMHNYAAGIYLYIILSNGVVQKHGKIIKE